MTARLGLGHRLAPPRFLVFIAISLAGFAVAILSAGWARAAMIGFDLGALSFLLLCIPLLGHEAEAMRDAADRNDANRVLLLVVTAMVCSVILVAVAVELSQRDARQPLSIALVIATLLLAWLFSNLVYALHYAHLYYASKPKNGGDCAGIDFPDDEQPDYWDFIYFAFTIGMTFQTSDIEISSRRIRRIAILHSFAAFIFNIGVLAFTINVLGG